MLIALCDEHGFLRGISCSTTDMSAKDAAEKYPIAFADVCDKSISAASKSIPLKIHPLHISL